MSTSDPTRAAREQYAPRVEAYRASRTHADAGELARMVDLLQPRPGSRALDVATGGGNAARALAGAGCRVVAVDVTDGFLRGLPGGVEGVGADAEGLPFREGAFEVVACRIAAHHFRDVDRFVREAGRVLAPGGRLHVFDLATPEDPEAAATVDRIERLRDPSHVHSRNLREWARAAAGAGLVVGHLRRTTSDLPLEEWLLRAGPEAAAQTEVRRILAERRPEALGGYGLVAPGTLRVLRVEMLARKV